jgi:hypothetical protein
MAALTQHPRPERSRHHGGRERRQRDQPQDQSLHRIRHDWLAETPFFGHEKHEKHDRHSSRLNVGTGYVLNPLYVFLFVFRRYQVRRDSLVNVWRF